MIAICYIIFDTLNEDNMMLKKEVQHQDLRIKRKSCKHVVTSCLMVMAHSENLESFAVCTHRGTWCHQMVWSDCH